MLDLGFVDHRAAQEAAAVVSVGLDHFQRKAHRLRLAIHSYTGELKQQPVGVVELCAVVGAAVELPDVGRPKIICFNSRPYPLEGRLDAAQVEVVVLEQAH